MARYYSKPHDPSKQYYGGLSNDHLILQQQKDYDEKLRKLTEKMQADRERSTGAFEIRPFDWKAKREAATQEQVRVGVLRKLICPKYDTVKLDGKSTVTDQTAFIFPVGMSDGTGYAKTYADTNMAIGAQLGFPVHGYWTYLRVHFDRYTTLEDVMGWKEAASIDFLMGQCEVVWRGTLGTMEPLLPEERKEFIARRIKKGVIRFWPWYEAKFAPTYIDSCDVFSVRISYKGGFRPEHPMQIKLLLGPFLYGPVT